jgi:hypothetical protein
VSERPEYIIRIARRASAYIKNGGTYSSAKPRYIIRRIRAAFWSAEPWDDVNDKARVSCCSLGLFGPLTLAQSHPWAAAVLVYELDAST